MWRYRMTMRQIAHLTGIGLDYIRQFIIQIRLGEDSGGIMSHGFMP
jgi:hypothetical protein